MLLQTTLPIVGNTATLFKMMCGLNKRDGLFRNIFIADKPVLTVRLGHGIVEDRIIGMCIVYLAIIFF